MQISVNEIKRVIVSVQVEEADLVAVNGAARIMKKQPSTVSRMIDRGELPDYRREGDLRGTRYTSREAIEKLLKTT